MRICKICNVNKLGPEHKNKKGYCNSCGVNFRRFELKAKWVKYKGGKCVCCGYDKSNEALSFHHLDPSKKDFNLSSKYCLAESVIKKELDKCVLVCMNCHQEIHGGIIRLSDVLSTSKSIDPPVSRLKLYYLDNVAPKVKQNQDRIKFDEPLIEGESYLFSMKRDELSKEKIKIKIEEMVKTVWSMPIPHVAKKYECSIPTIMKFCAENKIPMPRSNFWNSYVKKGRIPHPNGVINENFVGEVRVATEGKRVCTSCSIEKDLYRDFSYNSKERGIHRRSCKECDRKKSAEVYKKKQKMLGLTTINKSRKEQTREFVIAYLREKGFIQPINKIECTNRYGKRVNIESLIKHGKSTDTIENILSTCIIKLVN